MRLRVDGRAEPQSRIKHTSGHEQILPEEVSRKLFHAPYFNSTQAPLRKKSMGQRVTSFVQIGRKYSRSEMGGISAT